MIQLYISMQEFVLRFLPTSEMTFLAGEMNENYLDYRR
jgi:hypothetical protein